MEDESANEMDSNTPTPSHHHIEPTLNDSRKRTNQVKKYNRIFLFDFSIKFSLIKLVIIIHRYPWLMVLDNKQHNNKIFYQVNYFLNSNFLFCF